MFAAVMGLCWLTTVPLTNALLASIYGGKHMSMVSGVAFFFHQVGTAHCTTTVQPVTHSPRPVCCVGG